MPSIIHIERVTTRIRDRAILKDTEWSIEKGENWAIIGPNGSGKTSLAKLLTREMPVISGVIRYGSGFNPATDIASVSFEDERRIHKREIHKEEARLFSGKIFDYTKVSDLLKAGMNNPYSQRMVELTGTGRLMKRNLTRLSTGEFRKVLITKTLLNRPKLLILDEPLEGLDSYSRQHLGLLVDQLINEGIQVIMITHRLHVVPSLIQNILCVKDNRVTAMGKRDVMLNPDFISTLYGTQDGDPFKDKTLSSLFSFPDDHTGEELIRMNRITVRYSDVCVFKNLSWSVRRGEKWMVTGPNGSGKSTLLSLISGDNPQAYANDIYLFGKRRGTGESIWDIKKRIGFVSSEFHIRYQLDLTVLDVILSGFFDSVGLYRRYTTHQKAVAMKWLDILGFQGKEGILMTRLSFGEQKLILIARAMVKSPDILILDEPCQGLDPENRRKILWLISSLGRLPETTLIYVSHHKEELLECFDHFLALS